MRLFTDYLPGRRPTDHKPEQLSVEEMSEIGSEIIPALILAVPRRYLTSAQDNIEFGVDGISRSITISAKIPSIEEISSALPRFDSIKSDSFVKSKFRVAVPIAVMPSDKIYRATVKVNGATGVPVSKEPSDAIRQRALQRIRSMADGAPGDRTELLRARVSELESSYTKFIEVEVNLGQSIEIIATWEHEREVTFDASWGGSRVRLVDNAGRWIAVLLSKLRYFFGGRPNVIAVHTRMPDLVGHYSVVAKAPEGMYFAAGFATYYPRGIRASKEDTAGRRALRERIDGGRMQGLGCSLGYFDIRDTGKVAGLCKVWFRLYHKAPGAFGAAFMVGLVTSTVLFVAMVAIDKGRITLGANLPGYAVGLVVGMPASVLALTAMRLGTRPAVRYPSGAVMTVVLAFVATLFGGLLLATKGLISAPELLAGNYLPTQTALSSILVVALLLSFDGARAWVGTQVKYRRRRTLACIGTIAAIAVMISSIIILITGYTPFRVGTYDDDFFTWGYHTVIGGLLIAFTARCFVHYCYGVAVHWNQRGRDRKDY